VKLRNFKWFIIIIVVVIIVHLARYRPGRGGGDDMPPAAAADGSSTVAYRWHVMDPKIAADPRPSEHLWWPVVAKLHASSVPVA